MATAPVTTAINNDSGIVGDFITNDATLILSGTGVNGERVAIRYYAGESPTDDLIGPFSNSHYADSSKWALVSGGVWSLDLSDTSAFTSDPPPTITPTAITMVEGANTIYAYAYDGSWAGPHRLVITLDTTPPPTPPALTMISPDTGASASDRITNSTPVTFSATVDPNETLSLIIFDGGTTVVPVIADGAGLVTFEAHHGPNIPGYTVQYSLQRQDAAGNTATSAPLTITFDNVAPTHTTDSSTLLVIIGGTATITYTFSEAVVGFDLADLSPANGTLSNFQTIAPNQYSVVFTPVADIEWYGGVAVGNGFTDIAGNTGIPGASLFLPIDTIAPILTNVAFSDPQLASGETATVTLTFYQAVSGWPIFDQAVSGFTIGDITAANGTLSAFQMLTPTSYSVLFTPTPGFNGTGSVTIANGSFTDVNGNAGIGGGGTVGIDTAAPTVAFTAIINDTGTSATDLVTNDNALVWSGTVSEDATLLVESRLAGFGWSTIVTALPVTAGPIAFGPTLPLTDGVREFRVTATDAAGNVGPALTISVTIDTVAPPAPSITAITTDTNTAADFITSDRTLVFSGTAEAGSTITLSRTGLGVVGTGTTNGMGVWTVDLTGGNQPFATMQFTAVATDLAGNASGASAAQQVIVFPGNLTITPAGAQYFQTFNGNWGDDTIIAAAPSTHNTAHGMYGDDYISLNGYFNIITGGEGNDSIWGGQGFASIDGGAGDDQIVADGNGNTISGGAGNDVIWGGQGNSTIDGGAGNNIIYINGWNNLVTVGDGNNTIQDIAGQGTIIAGNGNNTIALLGWNNNLTLGNGNNHVMVAWGGQTSITTGNGNNTIELSGWNNLVTTGSGNDAIWAGMGMSTISAGGGHDTVWLGGSGASRVDLGAGNDEVYTGNAWADTLIGGLGDDQFVLVNASSIVIENPGEGTDTVWVNFTGYTMAANVEWGRIYGANDVALTGNGLDNTMVAFGTGSMLDGQGGHDALWGTANADVFKGGLGNDAIYGGGGLDRYIYDANAWGNDGIADWVAGQKLDFTGSGLSFTDLVIASGGGDSSVSYAGSTIMVFGAASLAAGDFVFG
ncbi:MAG: Ig-like domain-containing protein [Alphaproteobacteria bacterium]|nr:Ig-like domain-containing protein [Alphaproteobacteria bacterium]